MGCVPGVCWRRQRGRAGLARFEVINPLVRVIGAAVGIVVGTVGIIEKLKGDRITQHLWFRSKSLNQKLQISDMH